MLSSDLKRLYLISCYCDDITEFIKTKGADYGTFDSDNMYYHSVSMCLLQIAKKLSVEYTKSTSERIDWKAVNGMRDWFAHGYETMSKDTIWNTAINDIPKLKELCSIFVEKYDSQKSEYTPDTEQSTPESDALSATVVASKDYDADM